MNSESSQQRHTCAHSAVSRVIPTLPSFTAKMTLKWLWTLSECYWLQQTIRIAKYCRNVEDYWGWMLEDVGSCFSSKLLWCRPIKLPGNCDEMCLNWMLTQWLFTLCTSFILIALKRKEKKNKHFCYSPFLSFFPGVINKVHWILLRDLTLQETRLICKRIPLPWHWLLWQWPRSSGKSRNV